MSTSLKKSTDELSEVIRLLDNVLAHQSNLAVLELEVYAETREALITGNKLGLVRMARLILKLARDGVSGSDFHFDKHSNLEEASGALVVQKQANESA